MPRITFQVLIPFILILLLTLWREKPKHWYWIMLIIGLMAFVHPVSTPIWAFTLWLGFWIMFPSNWGAHQKIREMFKLGITLTLALLPYISIYLSHHQSGGGNSNYDLVYYVLSEYFPANIINIPAAVATLITRASSIGLLWYGLIGLAFSFILFHNERPRLKQLSVWVMGIVFISILVPWVETTIEQTFRLIPLQTELMRGMRYLIPFLIIFWFYPLSQITKRSINTKLTNTIFIVGTITTFLYLYQNTPYPYRAIPSVINCWNSGKIICPTITDHVEALTYIRENTPENSTFAVFLTNRWSGIEVRYLALRPMVYAYKDKGQLLFTNLDALQQWAEYQGLEGEIFHQRASPNLEDKLQKMVEFAHTTQADYILTNFAFSEEMQELLNVTAVYQNDTFFVLRITSE
jgi:hypothetical protein